MAHESTTSPATGSHRPRPDDTPPRNQVIFTYTVLAVITLIGLKFVFDSYMDVSRRDQRRTNISRSLTSEALSEYREQQRERLEQGAMPIERAITELGRRGRGAFPAIRPTPSQDRDALRGWAQLPREVPAGGVTAPAGVEGVAPIEGATGAEGVVPEGAAPAGGAEVAPPGSSPTEAAPSQGAATGATGAAAAQPAAPTEGTAVPTTSRTARPRRAAAPAAEAAQDAPPPSE